MSGTDERAPVPDWLKAIFTYQPVGAPLNVESVERAERQFWNDVLRGADQVSGGRRLFLRSETADLAFPEPTSERGQP